MGPVLAKMFAAAEDASAGMAALHYREMMLRKLHETEGVESSEGRGN